MTSSLTKTNFNPTNTETHFDPYGQQVKDDNEAIEGSKHAHVPLLDPLGSSSIKNKKDDIGLWVSEVVIGNVGETVFDVVIVKHIDATFITYYVRNMV